MSAGDPYVERDLSRWMAGRPIVTSTDVARRQELDTRDAHAALINARERIRELTSEPSEEMVRRAIIRAREAAHATGLWEDIVRAVLDERTKPRSTGEPPCPMS